MFAIVLKNYSNKILTIKKLFDIESVIETDIETKIQLNINELCYLKWESNIIRKFDMNCAESLRAGHDHKIFKLPIYILFFQ